MFALAGERPGQFGKLLPALEEVEKERQDIDRYTQDLLTPAAFQECLPIEAAVDPFENKIQINKRL